MIWPDSIPPEVSSAAAKAPDGRTQESKRPKGHLRLAHSEPPPGVAESRPSPAPSAADDELPPGLEASPAPAPTQAKTAPSLVDVSEPQEHEPTDGEAIESPRPSAKKLPSYLRVIK